MAWEEIFGSPADRSTWASLDAALSRKLVHESGGTIGIRATCVDAGDGVMTGYVLDYCRDRRARRAAGVAHALAIKGQSQPGKPPIGRPTKVDVTVRGVTAPRSAMLWPVGSDTIKGWYMGRLQNAGAVHFPAGLPDDFYAQLTAERLQTKFVRGMPVKRWVKASSARNEALDASVYAYAAAVFAGLKRANWRALVAEIKKPKAQEEAPPVIRAPKPRGGFVNGWRR